MTTPCTTGRATCWLPSYARAWTPSGSLVDGSQGFQLAELAQLQRAGVVVEGRDEELLDLDHVQPGYVLNRVARVQLHHPGIPIV